MTEDLRGLGRQLDGFFAGRVQRGVDPEDLAHKETSKSGGLTGDRRKERARESGRAAVWLEQWGP